MKLPDAHKVRAGATVVGWGSVAGALIWLMTNFSDVANFMYHIDRFIQLMPKIDSVAQMAPSMKRLVEDYDIIHSLMEDEEKQKLREQRRDAHLDSLTNLVDIILYGKAPYQDTIWYMNEYGQWIKCNIKDHPTLR